MAAYTATDMRVRTETPDRPGSRMIYLACSDNPDSYFDLDRTDLRKVLRVCEKPALELGECGTCTLLVDGVPVHVDPALPAAQE